MILLWVISTFFHFLGCHLPVRAHPLSRISLSWNSSFRTFHENFAKRNFAKYFIRNFSKFSEKFLEILQNIPKQNLQNFAKFCLPKLIIRRIFAKHEEYSAKLRQNHLEKYVFDKNSGDSFHKTKFLPKFCEISISFAKLIIRRNFVCESNYTTKFCEIRKCFAKFAKCWPNHFAKFR